LRNDEYEADAEVERLAHLLVVEAPASANDVEDGRVAPGVFDAYPKSFRQNPRQVARQSAPGDVAHGANIHPRVLEHPLDLARVKAGWGEEGVADRFAPELAGPIHGGEHHFFEQDGARE